MATFSAVRTTGIYCRPGCGARPRAENVVTFELAATAEGGRLSRLPEVPSVSNGRRGQRERARVGLPGGAADPRRSARRGHRDRARPSVGVSARHLRRLFHEHLGVTPTQLASSRRAHFARRMLDDSDLTITQVALRVGLWQHQTLQPRDARGLPRLSPRSARPPASARPTRRRWRSHHAAAVRTAV